MSRPSAISRQASHCPQGSAVGPFAQLALPAGLGRRPVRAVERPGQNAGRRGLADAAGTGEDECLRDAPGAQRVLQRPRDRLLADHVVETLRPPLASQDLV
jgi:hypothetical protein